MLEMKNHLFPPVHTKPGLHKIDSESAWDHTQSFSQPYRPSARVRQLEQMLGMQEGRAHEETMPKNSLQAMVRWEHMERRASMLALRTSTLRPPRSFNGRGRD